MNDILGDVFGGLRVVAKRHPSVRPESVGKVARVTAISDSYVFYTYEFDGFTGLIEHKHFWRRFERIKDSAPTGVAATAGHCAGNGGLRGHSVGDVFPVVVYQRGNPGFITHWLRLPDGRDIGPYHSYDDVHRAAAWHKDNL